MRIHYASTTEPLYEVGSVTTISGPCFLRRSCGFASSSLASGSRNMEMGARLLDRARREGLRDVTGDEGRVAGGDHNPNPASPRDAPSPGVVKYSGGLEGNSLTERLESLFSFEIRGEVFSGPIGTTHLEDAGWA